MLFFIVCAAFAACTDEVSSTLSPDNGKTPIVLSIGGLDTPQERATTRAVITDGVGKTLRAFTGQTRLFFAMVAEDGSGNKKFGFNYGTAAGVSSPAVDSKSAITFPDNYLYWDDAYARDSKVSVYSIAVANKERGNVALTPGGSIVIGTESPGKAIIPFTTTSPGEPTFKWQIGDSDGGSAYKQDQNIFEWADLVFSNNIVNYTSSGGTDNRLKFHTDPSDGDMYHKFDQGELIYYHALTQFTIKIKCGDGFKGDGTDFKFTNTTGVACTTPNNSFGLNGFYGAEGVFRVGNGEFDAMTSSNLRNYTSIYKVNETHQKASSGEYYLMKAYVFPGTDMTGSKDDAFSFVIDGNKYDISSAMLYDAIKLGQTNVDKQGSSPSKVDASILDEITIGEGGKKLKAGYNYEFTFTVEKSKIKNITAQVVDWESINAEEQFPSNARITLNLEERGDALTSTDHFSFYRAAKDNTGAINDDYTTYDWKTGYNTVGVTPTYVSTPSAHWTTDWFWDSNLNYYHFRALAKDNGSTKVVAPNSVVTDSDNGDYYALSHGETYTDILWGAPMKDVEPGNETSDAATLKWNYGPTINGFDGLDTKATDAHQIYKAIGPTRDAVKLILFHMMSNVTFNIKTTTGADKVDLGDGSVGNATTIRLEKIHTSGKLLMGNGLVLGTTADVANSNYTFTATPAPDGSGIVTWSNYGAIPQDLINVILVITTPDHNQYKVKLWDSEHPITATVTNNNIANPYEESSTAGKYKINRWYPGFKYTYSFTLAKTGITNMQATIVDWENVSADNETVKIQ